MGLPTTPGSATEKQTGFIHSLLDDRDLFASPKFFDAVNAMDSEEYAAFIERLKQQVHEEYSMDQASRMITALKELPRKARESSSRRNGREDGPDPEAGMYRLEDGTIVRVYLGQQSGKMLAKKLVSHEEYLDDHGHEVRHSYEYMGKASRFVSTSTRKLTLEEAKEFGRMTGTCCVCARRLDVPESVEAGIGPVCAGRLDR